MPEIRRNANAQAELKSASSTSDIEGRRDVDWLRQTSSEQDQLKTREHQEVDALPSTSSQTGYGDVLHHLTLERSKRSHGQRTTSDLPMRQILKEKTSEHTTQFADHIYQANGYLDKMFIPNLRHSNANAHLQNAIKHLELANDANQREQERLAQQRLAGQRMQKPKRYLE
jgi:hypothetical protein